MAKPAQNLSSRLNLNLLHPQSIPQKFPIRFLRWLVSYGRYLVIVVEIIVLGSFAARFKFDADLSELKNKINNLSGYIATQTDNESLIRKTQLRIFTIKRVYSSSPNWKNSLDVISLLVPPGVHFRGININPGQKSTNVPFRILAQANSINDLAIFLNGLKTSPQFQNISLDSISFDEGQTNFSISGEIR